MQTWHLQYEQNNLPSDYTVKGGMLFFQNKILVLDMQQLKEAIFHMFHESLMARHGGTQKTYKAISNFLLEKYEK